MYDDEKENRLIAKAQEGNASAMEELLTKYRPAIKAAVKKVAPFYDVDDAMQTASLRFIEMVYEHDIERGTLTARIKQEILWALREESTLNNSQFRIPARSQRRYLSFMKKAGNDVVKAAEIVEAHKMPRHTFFRISNIVSSNQSIDAGGDWLDILYHDQEFVDLETNQMAQEALSCLDGDERYVVEAFYGFADFRSFSDAEIADALNKTKRQVRAMRQKAVLKMRVSLGVIAVDQPVAA